MSERTLVRMLQRCAALKSIGVTFIEDSIKEDFLSYNQLYAEALKVLSFFQAEGVEGGNEMILQVEDNKTYLIVFWACILGGIIPVPLSIGQKDDHKKKLFQVWTVLKKPYLIASASVLEKLKIFAEQNGLASSYLDVEKSSIAIADIYSSDKAAVIFECQEDDIAFLQFSSGSTGYPKGIILTHQNLLTNIAAISKAAAYSATDTMLSWMPLTHDMGMIGFHLNPLFMQVNHYLIPTDAFVRRPSLWLDKATKHAVSILCSPNFGYKYVLKHCTEVEAAKWDLKAVRLIYNGAEPISEKLCHDFSEFLADYGLKENRIRPVYGLAEATLAVSISELEDEVITCYLDRTQMKAGDEILIVNRSDHHAVPIVNVGKAIESFSIIIADPHGLPLKDQVIGKIYIKGASVTAGYYNNEEETDKVVQPGGWLDTGDLGFIMNGSLYITGRSKDVIFINGQNYYPHDIENIAHSVKGIELNKIVIAGFFNHSAQKNEIIAFIFHRGALDKFVPIYHEVKAYVNSKTGIELDSIIPVKDIPRTTSGKLQRFRLIEFYIQGTYKAIGASLVSMLNTATDEKIVPAETVIEHRLLTIWKSLLGSVNFGITHDFFAIGGNSLRAAEFGMNVLKEFNVELSFEVIYKKRTIKELAMVIGSSALKEYHPIPVAPEYPSYPVSPVQRRLYFAWAMDKSSLAYNLPSAFSLAEEPDPEKIEKAVNQLITKHDSLRMTFLFTDEPEFKINGDIVFTLKVKKAAKDELIEELLRGMVKPFDLTSGPLFRIELIKMASGYLLFTDFHHIISDGLSVYMFLNELFLLYHGHELEELPIGYKDYAVKEVSAMDLTNHEKYWLDHLKGELPVLQMATDFQRPVIFDTNGGRVKFQLEGEVVPALKKLALTNKSTLHALLLAIYRILLFKYSGQQELIVGIPVAGRNHPDLQHLQGMFVNNLALKGPLMEGKGFIEYLESVTNSTNAGLSHQVYPFDYLIHKMNVKQDAGRNPLFDTMFMFQEIDLEKIGGRESLSATYFFDPEISKFDLSMEIHYKGGDNLTCFLEYSKSLFKKETALRIADHFKNLVAEILKDPFKQVTALRMISGEKKYPDESHFSKESFRQNNSIWPLIELQFNTKANHIAISDNENEMTYSALAEAVSRQVKMLERKGFKTNDVVGIQLGGSADFVISLLAVMKAGGIFVPIDPELPEERINYLLQNSKARFIINKEHGIIFNQHTNGNEEPETKNLAYILYTSGTTGDPKGVMIAHYSLFNYITWAAETYVGTEELDFPLFTSVSFDLTLTSVFVPLITGNQIIIYRDGDGEMLIEKIVKDNKAGVVKLTPSHLRILRELPLHEPMAMKRKLRKFIVGGENFDSQLARDIFYKFNGNVELFNEYGPTEATVGCMIHRYHPEEKYLSVPIGIPIPHTRLYILDKYLMPVPEGVIAELYISGEGLAQGYLFNEVLTHEKFIANPFLDGELMYKTGDLVRQIDGGLLEYVGRTDSQVKINGYRIEPSEIEFHLASHENISDAVVVLTDSGSAKILSAFFVCKDINDPVAANALRDFLSLKLPHYMVPARFIVLNAIPLTKNGKIDYQALQKSDIQEQSVKVKHGATTPMESAILEVWEKVLRQNNFSITDNFFEVGGDSIKAVQIASRLLEKGIKVEAKKILTYQTVQEISKNSKYVEITVDQKLQNNDETVKGLTPIASWFFGQQFKTPEFFNQSVVLKFKKKADIKLLEEAFQYLIAHHDGLRSNYAGEKQIPFINDKHLNQAFLIERVAEPGLLMSLKSNFHLETSLLIKAAVFSDYSTNDFLFITAHHLVIDGVSWRIFLDDLYTLYNQLQTQQQVLLPSKTTVSIDWDKIRNIPKYKEQEEYWKIQESATFSVPLDFETDQWTIGTKGKVNCILEQEETAFLTGKANRPYKTDTQMLLLTAIALALKNWTGKTQVVIEMENHGRNVEFADFSRTIGWFTAMYPLILETGDSGIGSQIKNIKEQIRAIPDDGIGYGILRHAADNEFANKISEVRFNYLGNFDAEFDNDLFGYTGDYHTEDTAPGNQLTAKLDFNLMIMNGSLHTEMAFNTEAHKVSTMTILLDSFNQYLNLILEHTRNENDVHFSPSDFDAVAIDQNELDSLFD
ncbi:non-ribosomal peptide synthase domain TIGR01720/amino acid adenylation domain-containing protein [Pedobacter suwonensis]|uniref:Non-ribosomal peptide synthase domain TIGR01720/amino acid adenylation domain-containing protein n=1 Tax=Pedobacter suwonensis TaxID=332999 RepID=A0A1I0TN80_9SPHI|nr:non-ribosomal peptide synthetase [Pedobacter suwonensis]SFA53242.1 non-ribosomal peptide synthase domain TIGR01720/amino acid adenylation domain-containing protein [Pedobacter suwonensis]